MEVRQSLVFRTFHPARAELVILHMESPSLVAPLGAKGIGEGNCMSVPVCIAILTNPT